MNSVCCAAIVVILGLVPARASAQQYAVAASIPLGGRGAWDYLKADPDARRLYVSHSAEVVVVDLDTHKRIGQMNGFGFVHGIVIVKGLNTGFLSDGQKNEVVTFDPKTLQIKERIRTVANPNSMAYDAKTRRLFVGHKPSKSVTVINAATRTIEGRIELPGIPEFPATDGRTSLFVNIEDKNEMVRIDTHTLKIVAHYPLAPCTGPGGLAIDLQRHRLFAACDNKIMAVVNSDTGAVVASLPIGNGPDAARFDPGTRLAFSSNGEGNLTVIKEEGEDRYSVIQTVATEPGARTMALDERTHTIFLSTARLGAPPAPTAENPHPPSHPTAVAGSFKLVVVSPVGALSK